MVPSPEHEINDVSSIKMYVQYIKNEYLWENCMFLIMTNKVGKKDIQEVISEKRWLSKHEVIYRIMNNK